jgi:hypothetical protein
MPTDESLAALAPDGGVTESTRRTIAFACGER